MFPCKRMSSLNVVLTQEWFETEPVITQKLRGKWLAWIQILHCSQWVPLLQPVEGVLLQKIHIWLTAGRARNCFIAAL